MIYLSIDNRNLFSLNIIIIKIIIIILLYEKQVTYNNRLREQ